MLNFHRIKNVNFNVCKLMAFTFMEPNVWCSHLVLYKVNASIVIGI